MQTYIHVYATNSTSWDEDVEGSFLGIDELKVSTVTKADFTMTRLFACL
jgi:hypothetical protein